MQNTIALHLPDNSSAAQVVFLSKSVGSHSIIFWEHMSKLYQTNIVLSREKMTYNTLIMVR